MKKAEYKLWCGAVVLALCVVLAVPASADLLRDIPYGDAERQRMDVYRPDSVKAGAPVIFMVHGGGWRRGNKAMANVFENKTARWLPQGFIFISTNYRLLPDADPLRQAEDVAKALAAAQKLAPSWGGDPDKFILMGHSAGAHLVALLSAAPSRALAVGAKPWLGVVALDSGAFDVVQTMQAKHFRLFDNAFGTDPEYWRSVSPLHALTAEAPPFLVVCSSRRKISCAQAHDFAAKAKPLGVHVQVMPQDLSHGEINSKLGLAGNYTQAVEVFLASLLAAKTGS
jgi:arylformamidase